MPPEAATLARGFVLVLAIYLLVGALFAPWFAFRGVNRIDPHAREATLGFRLIIVPGVVALWPLLTWRVLSGPTAPPEEHNAHRSAARRATPAASTTKPDHKARAGKTASAPARDEAPER